MSIPALSVPWEEMAQGHCCSHLSEPPRWGHAPEAHHDCFQSRPSATAGHQLQRRVRPSALSGGCLRLNAPRCLGSALLTFPHPRPLSRNLRALTSDVFISSISAKVGALSRTRGRGRCMLLPAPVTDRLMQDVDLVSPEQALRMQGREPNPGGGREVGQGSTVRGADGVGR